MISSLTVADLVYTNLELRPLQAERVVEVFLVFCARPPFLRECGSKEGWGK